MFESLPSEYISGFLSGTIATLLGFGLTIIWDTIKYYRDRTKRDNAILLSFRHELQGNIDILRANKKILDDELKSIEEGQYWVIPLQPLHESMWGVLALNMPKKFIDTPDIIDVIRNNNQTIMHVSEVINSRESYRINNSGMTNYKERIKIYDTTLVDAIPDIIHNMELLVQNV